MTAILNQIAEKWFSWQLSMFWQVGLLIIIVAGLDLLIKKWVWPQVRYALWLLILVKLVLPPTLTSPTSFTAEIPFMVKQTAIKISQPQTPHAIKPVIVPVTEPIPADTTTQPVEIIPAPYTAPATPAGTFLSGKTYVFFVWLAGVGILSGWLTIRLSNLRHQHLKDKQSNLPERLEDLLVSTARKLGLRKVPQAILTNKVCCPAVFGIFRPVLLMPADKLQNLTTQDAEHIFLHELAHIKRGDLFVHAVYMILQIAYWFNPLLWLIRKNLQNLRELCCDATVARLLKEKTIGYRQTLLETAKQLLAEPVDPGLGLLGLFENSSWLVDRLRWLEKKSWKYRPLKIATIFVLICVMSACVLPMTKFKAPVDFVIKGTVTDAQTGKPIAGAKVGDTEKYADGKFYTTADANGNYSYKTYYEEHGVKAEADGYKRQNKGFGTKLFGKEKEKVINFALRASAGSVPTSEPEKRASEAENKLNSQDNITDLAQTKNMMATLGGVFNATRSAISDNSPDSAVKIMEETLPQFEKFESTVKGTNYSESVHLIVEQIRLIIKANKGGDSARVRTLLLASSNSWYKLEEIVMSDYRDSLSTKNLEDARKIKNESQISAGQDEGKNEKSGTSKMNSKIDKFDIDHATRSDVIKVFGEPTKYIWGTQVFDKNSLPDQYIMSYPSNFHVWMVKDQIIEFRFEGPSDYVFGDGLVVGSTIEKALNILGQPSEIVEGKPNEFKDNVFYKDINGRKGHCYYGRPEKNIRIWFFNDKVCAIYITRSDFRNSVSGGKESKETELSKTSFIDKDGRIVDKIDYLFVNDPEVIGGWTSVDFVKNIEDFKPGAKNWQGDLFLKELFLLEGGKTNWAFTWTKGLILNSGEKTASKYIIKEIDGSKYMFFEWKSGDYVIGHRKPAYYVLEQNKDAVYVESTTIDKIDYPFVNDPRVLGKWESVDFVDEIEQFKAGYEQWKGGDLFLKEMIFEKNGRLTLKNDKVPTGYSQSWTKGLVISEENKTASRYTTKQINEDDYLFYEWKSGDYTIRGMKPKYYVLKKEPAGQKGNRAVEQLGPDKSGFALRSNSGTGEKEKLQNLVEDFFKDNYRDIKQRKTIEWGEPIIDDTGNQTIRYKYEANIWDSKDRYIFNELFTFNKNGKYVSSKKISMILKDYPADNKSSAEKAANPIDFEITGQTFRPGDSIEITEIRGSTDKIQTGQIYTVKGKYKLSSSDKAVLNIYATNGNIESEQGPVVNRGTGDFSRTFTYSRDGWLHLSFYPADGGSSFGSLYFAQKGSGQKMPDISQITDVISVETSKPASSENVDLYIEDFSIRPYEAGGLYVAAAKIGNKGNATSPPFRMNFFKGDPKENLNLHGKPQSGDYGAGPIEPGKFWNELSTPFALKKGLTLLTVVLDTENSVAETNKLNNFATITSDKEVNMETGIDLQKSAGQGEMTGETNNVSEKSAENVKTARTLRITIYEGNDVEPQTSVRIPLVAMKIVRQLLPSKDKLQIIAQKIKLDESLPQDMNSQDLIEMLDGMLTKLDEGVQSTTLLEVKDGDERIIIVLE
jgi:beta-lactamase regulating signal transducer with metallopeptidase domain